MKYQHTQIGYLIISTLTIVILLFVSILSQASFDLFVITLMFFILFVLASFVSLQVMITENYLRIKFGYGIFQKKFLLNEIISAKIVKNHWYYGWGIRFWPWTPMWIYNVSGFAAVEIVMSNGKIYRIGTDQPEELEQAILQTIRK